MRRLLRHTKAATKYPKMYSESKYGRAFDHTERDVTAPVSSFIVFRMAESSIAASVGSWCICHGW